MGGLISIAVTGINAAQLALMTTGNNISNASTEGYTRQRISQASNSSVMTGSGAVGTGTHVVTIERMFSETLNRQVLNAQSKVSSLDSYSAQISQINNLLGNSKSGLTANIQGFFDAIQAVASSKSSLSARQTLVSAADTMVSGFKGMYDSLVELRTSVNSQVVSSVDSINSYAKQIADLNKQIVRSQGLSGQTANDLLDARDTLVAQLNKVVGVSVSTADDGSYNVFFGTGQQLVVGTTASTLAAVTSAADPSRTVVGTLAGNGSVLELPESQISGGELGGLINFRLGALDVSFNELGRLTASVAQTYNAQNALGQDLSGNILGDSGFVADFFKLADPVTIPNDHNTGSASVNIALDDASYNGTNFYTNLTTSDYQLNYASGSYTLTRLSDGFAWSGSSITDINNQVGKNGTNPQGFTFDPISGTMQNGDSYLIQPSRDLTRGFSIDQTVASDPRLIAAASPIAVSGDVANTGNVSSGGLSVSEGYSISGLPVSGMALTYNSATGSLSGFPNGTVVVSPGGTYNIPTDTVPFRSGAKISIQSADGSVTGVSFTLSGTPANGDTFRLSPNTGGVEDGSNMLLLGKLQTQNTSAGNTATFADAYASYVNDIGNKASSAKTSAVATTVILKTAQDAKSSLSGVNLDEEAAKLIQYQQAYQASAKVLSTASTLFDTLLSLAR